MPGTLHRSQDCEKHEADCGYACEKEEDQPVTSGHIEDVAGQNRTYRTAKIAAEHDDAEKNTVRPRTEQLRHRWRDHREEAAVGKAVNRGKEKQLPRLPGHL